MIIRGDSTGTARFGPAFVFPAVGLTVDGATWETNNNSLPAVGTFTGTSGWSVRTAAQTFGGTSDGEWADHARHRDQSHGERGLRWNGAITKTSAGTLTLTAGGIHSGGITMAANGGTISIPGTLTERGAISVARQRRAPGRVAR